MIRRLPTRNPVHFRFMAAVDTAAQRQSSTIALLGPDRALIRAGKLGQPSTDDICCKAKGKRRSFISAEIERSNSGSVLNIARQTRTQDRHTRHQPGRNRIQIGRISLEESLTVSNE